MRVVGCKHIVNVELTFRENGKLNPPKKVSFTLAAGSNPVFPIEEETKNFLPCKIFLHLLYSLACSC